MIFSLVTIIVNLLFTHHKIVSDYTLERSDFHYEEKTITDNHLYLVDGGAIVKKVV